MKNYNRLVVVLSFFTVSIIGSAQNTFSLFHNDGEFNVGLKYGRGETTNSFNLTSEYIKSRSFGYTFDLTYDKELPDAFEFSNFDQFRFSGGILFNPLSGNTVNRIFWHLKSQIHIGNESVSSRVEELTESNFVFGGNIGTSVDYYIGKGLIVSLGFNQFYTYGSLVGDFHWESNLALRYIL